MESRTLLRPRLHTATSSKAPSPWAPHSLRVGSHKPTAHSHHCPGEIMGLVGPDTHRWTLRPTVPIPFSSHRIDTQLLRHLHSTAQHPPHRMWREMSSCAHRRQAIALLQLLHQASLILSTMQMPLTPPMRPTRPPLRPSASRPSCQSLTQCGAGPRAGKVSFATPSNVARRSPCLCHRADRQHRRPFGRQRRRRAAHQQLRRSRRAPLRLRRAQRPSFQHPSARPLQPTGRRRQRQLSRWQGKLQNRP